MNNFAGIGMNYVADTANFIVVTPQALIDQQFTNSTAWNSGAGLFGFTLNANVDDIGFVNAMLDTLIANYNVDEARVFACGFSMGGFMTNRIGCELNHRFAAIASVAGTIGSGLNCTPGRPVPACHFHGTGDQTVAYTGNSYGSDAEDLATFWATNNNCNASPTITALPDVANDGYTITHYLYGTCDNAAEVELYKVDSAQHEWLTPLNDIFYTTEIWKFFSRHTHLTLDVSETEEVRVNLYPNPVESVLTVEADYKGGEVLKILDISGREVFTRSVLGPKEEIDISFLPAGTYRLLWRLNEQEVSRPFVIAR